VKADTIAQLSDQLVSLSARFKRSREEDNNILNHTIIMLPEICYISSSFRSMNFQDHS